MNDDTEIRLARASAATTQSRLLTATEVATRFRVSRRTIARWIATGRMRALKTTATQSGVILVTEDEVARVLEQMRRHAARSRDT